MGYGLGDMSFSHGIRKSIIMSLLSAVGFEPGTFGVHVSESEYMLALYLLDIII